MKPRKNTVQVRINVNVETKKAFDAACASQGQTMTAVIERFMEEYTRNSMQVSDRTEMKNNKG